MEKSTPRLGPTIIETGRRNEQVNSLINDGPNANRSRAGQAKG